MNTPFTQTKEYLNWHKEIGTKTFYLDFFRDISESENFQIDEEQQKELYAICACLIIELRIGKVLYVPYGPLFFPPSGKGRENEVVKKLREIAKQENCVFIRMENSKENNKKLNYTVTPPKKTYATEGIFQPRMEWWLDIKGENENYEEELFMRMNKDHRYSIRRAQKEGIQTEIVNLNHYLKEEEKEFYFEKFWNLLKITGERDGFHLYKKKYYEQIFNYTQGGGMKKKFLVFTKLGEKYLSVAVIVVSDKIANLVFAGSVGSNRELGFNHLMQWAAIQESMVHKCEIYNFGGITENGFGKESLTGVTNFKKKFGGYAKFHGEFVDIPIKKIRYFLYIIKKLF